jgi:hypothetical protein
MPCSFLASWYASHDHIDRFLKRAPFAVPFFYGTRFAMGKQGNQERFAEVDHV